MKTFNPTFLVFYSDKNSQACNHFAMVAKNYKDSIEKARELREKLKRDGDYYVQVKVYNPDLITESGTNRTGFVDSFYVYEYDISNNLLPAKYKKFNND